jgi:hypothetical protein
MNEIIAGLYQIIKALELQKNEMKCLQAKLDAKDLIIKDKDYKVFEIIRQRDLMVSLFKEEELKVKELKMEIVALTGSLTGYQKLWKEAVKKYNRLMNVVKSKGIKK